MGGFFIWKKKLLGKKALFGEKNHGPKHIETNDARRSDDGDQGVPRAAGAYAQHGRADADDRGTPGARPEAFWVLYPGIECLQSTGELGRKSAAAGQAVSRLGQGCEGAQKDSQLQRIRAAGQIHENAAQEPLRTLDARTNGHEAPHGRTRADGRMGGRAGDYYRI